MWHEIGELILWIVLVSVFVMFSVACMGFDHWKAQRLRRRERDELLESVIRKREEK